MKLKVNCVISNEYKDGITIQGLLITNILKLSLGLLYPLMECLIKVYF